MTHAIEFSVRELKRTIFEHDGQNVASSFFRAKVDDLISLFYDDIGEISNVGLHTLFDLFLIRVLYVRRRSTDADVMDYLSQMLSRYLYTKELFPGAAGEKLTPLYFSDLMDETKRLTRFQNLFEAYRRFADNSLFLTGVFPRALRRRRRGPSRKGRLAAPAPLVDVSYYVSTGKTCYRLASEHDLAEFTQQRETLEKLSEYFEVYMGALNEMSERYIMGFDMNLIADKMLDNFNLFRSTGEEKYLQNARKYAAILKVNEGSFPALFSRPPRAVLLDGPPGP